MNFQYFCLSFPRAGIPDIALTPSSETHPPAELHPQPFRTVLCLFFCLFVFTFVSHFVASERFFLLFFRLLRINMF